MARRFHVDAVHPGKNTLDRNASHHARTVLRLTAGAAVELFDDAGNIGRGEIIESDGDRVVVEISPQAHALGVGSSRTIKIHIASAVPKSSRADWMIEKLSELGVTRFTPLATDRAVVLPEGAGKLGRWARLAEEAARQSGRSGVMTIDPLLPLAKLLDGPAGVFGSTAPPTIPLLDALATHAEVPIAIGPEGGWTDSEIARMQAAGWRAVTLGPTTLRVETAALAAAVICSLSR